MKKILLFSAFVLLLSGCVVQDPDEENEAGGLWTGTTGDARSVRALVLNNGISYFFYSALSNANVTAGVIHGDATAENGTFTLTDGVHLSTSGSGTVNTGTIAGTFNPSAMNVIMTASGIGSPSFSGSSQSEFDDTPSLADVAGDYSGTITLLGLSESLTELEITVGGSITISSASCAATGVITASSSGNFYNVTLTTTTCTDNENSSFSGHAFLLGGTRLFLFAPNTGATSGILIDAT